MKFILLSIMLHIPIFILFSKNDHSKKIEKKQEIIVMRFESFNNNISKEELKRTKTEETEKTEERKQEIENLSKKEKIKKQDKNKSHKNINKKVAKKSKNMPNTKNNTIKNISEDVLSDGKGGYIVKNQGVKGITYSIKYSPNPAYPEKAKKIGYEGDIVVKVRFLIGENGDVEEVKFYTPKDKLGFQDEVRKVIYSWKFSPIKLNGKAVKLYFYKTFRFNQI